MRTVSPVYRLFADVVGVFAFVEGTLAFLLPAIAPGMKDTGGHLLDAAVMTVIVAPFVSWRIRTYARVLANHMTTHVRTSEANARTALAALSAYRAALDRHAIVAITDLSGTITEVNDNFCRISGYSRSDLIGAKHRIVNSGHHPKAFWVDMWRTINGGGAPIWRAEVCNRAKDGSLYWVDTTIGPVRDEAGKTVGFISIRFDTTSRKEVEDLLRSAHEKLEHRVAERTAQLEAATQSAEAASRAKSEFLAHMSHELRTPLNGVIGMNEILLGTDLNAQQRRYAWLAKSSGELLLKLINDVLDFSKIEAGKLELEQADFNPQYSVESVVGILASQAHQKGLELICRIHPGVPKSVRGDSGRFQQILVNLISNAIKFTEKGEVFVRMTCEHATPRQTTLRLSVTDSGIGIPQDCLDRLFKSFSQADASTTRKHGGTGLGLAITKQLVELMGGTIGVDTSRGSGTTFWFTARFENSRADDARPRMIPDDMRQVRILVVDDNATNREIVSQQLATGGLGTAQTVPDGQAALAALRQAAANDNPFHLALLDRQMPEMDGLQLAHAIKSDPQVRDTILILLSSQDEVEDEKKLKELGFSGHLLKPVRESQLVGTVAEALACASTEPRNLDADTAACENGIVRSKFAGARILIAEDDDINQEVAATLLAQAGFDCRVASNGKEALDAALGGGFDLILMDFQMPEMDGFEATRAIRDAERGCPLSAGGPERIPIIALTANAIQGDQARCIAAGMDDYVTKPVIPARLLNVIELHLAKLTRPRSQQEMPPSPGASTAGRPTPAVDAATTQKAQAVPPGDNRDLTPVFNRDALTKRYGNNTVLIDRLIAKFRARAAQEIADLQCALDAGDSEAVARLAHKLKGAAATVEAQAVRDLAARVEKSAKIGQRVDEAEIFTALFEELNRCTSIEETGKCAAQAAEAQPCES